MHLRAFIVHDRTAVLSATLSDPYTVDRFLSDTAWTQRLVVDSPAGLTDEEDTSSAMRAIWAYFESTYGRSSASHLFLRFGAVHAALCAHDDEIVCAGLGGSDIEPADPALLSALLDLPVLVDMITHEARLSEEAVTRAVRAVSLARPN